MSLKRVSSIDRACHGRKGDDDDFFYVYMAFFVQLHVRLPFNYFTMDVRFLLNVAPT